MGVGGSLGEMGVGGSLGQLGVFEMLGQMAEGESQKMKMEFHTEKVSQVLGCCSPHSHVQAEQGKHLVDKETPLGYLGTQVVVVLNTLGPLGFQTCLRMGRQDKDAWTLQEEGSRCCLGPQQLPLDKDLQPHQAEGQEQSLKEQRPMGRGPLD